MSKLALKTLLGIGGTGIVCATSAGLFFGLRGTLANGNIIAMNSLNGSLTYPELPEESSGQILENVTCQENGRSLPIESMPGVQIDEQTQRLLQEYLKNGCSSSDAFPEEDTEGEELEEDSDEEEGAED